MVKLLLQHYVRGVLQQVHKLPTSKRTKSMTVRVGRNQYGLGLVMSTNNTILSVEAGSMAAKSAWPSTVSLAVDALLSGS